MDIKVYLFYKKKDRSLYAYTADKKYYEEFKKTRNMKCFFIEKIKMDDTLFSIFLSRDHNYHLLTNDVLSDSKYNMYPIICTYYESEVLSEACDDIFNEMNYIEHIKNKNPFKEKYKKLLEKFIDQTEIDDGSGESPTLNINTFHIFYHLFKETLTDKNFQEE